MDFHMSSSLLYIYVYKTKGWNIFVCLQLLVHMYMWRVKFMSIVLLLLINTLWLLLRNSREIQTCHRMDVMRSRHAYKTFWVKSNLSSNFSVEVCTLCQYCLWKAFLSLFYTNKKSNLHINLSKHQLQFILCHLL